MEALALNDKSILFQSINDINTICLPLFSRSPIRFFRYAKVQRDGKYLSLCSNGLWLEHYFKNDYYNLAYFENNSFSWKNAPLMFIWTPLNNNLLTDAREYYDIDYGITLIETSEEYSEFFHFASNTQGSQAINFYLNHLDALQRFIAYFRFKAAQIIKKAESETIVLPSFNQSSQSDNLQAALDFNKNKFINETTMDYLVLNKGTKKEERLGMREMETCFFAINGKSSKETAQIMGISPKTVEAYLNSVKLKLDAPSKNFLRRCIPNDVLQHLEFEIVNKYEAFCY